MHNIEFYETGDGKSELIDYLEELRGKSKNDKNARIQYNQICLYIQLLEDRGLQLPEVIAKHIEGDIWELRPGKNRVLFCYYGNDEIVLLHHFRKKTRTTPRREILKAKSEAEDYWKRKGKK